MNTVEQMLLKIDAGEYDSAFIRMYGSGSVSKQRERYKEAVQSFGELFGRNRHITLFSAPGRTEIGGNHTDHNHGRVLAASINLDVIAVASPSGNNVIRVQSKGFELDTVELDDLSVKDEQKGRSCALIRGIADRFTQLKFNIGGFDAYTVSSVLKGSGLSSSAAFEVLIGSMLNHLYNGGRVDAVEIAKIGQYAENVHFDKPCGLMDQMASSVGGIISIDFADPQKPVIHKVDYDFASSGYHLCIVDTGGSHADLTPEYAAVTVEMKAISNSLGVSYLRETTIEKLTENIAALRKEHGDRAILRAIHFMRDNQRVLNQVKALESGDFEEFKRLIIESGHSSFEYLQNVFATGNVAEQGLSLALCLAQGMLSGHGAWRVHGGGFAGTTQNFVPSALLDEFCETMEGVFGKGSCHVLKIRPVGGVCLESLI